MSEPTVTYFLNRGFGQIEVEHGIAVEHGYNDTVTVATFSLDLGADTAYNAAYALLGVLLSQGHQVCWDDDFSRRPS